LKTLNRVYPNNEDADELTNGTESREIPNAGRNVLTKPVTNLRLLKRLTSETQELPALRVIPDGKVGRDERL
jgi:hypothetical protein